MSGDAHIANVIAKFQASAQWKNMAIIVTYDENGGFWNHSAPPKADRWGPGARACHRLPVYSASTGERSSRNRTVAPDGVLLAIFVAFAWRIHAYNKLIPIQTDNYRLRAVRHRISVRY